MFEDDNFDERRITECAIFLSHIQMKLIREITILCFDLVEMQFVWLYQWHYFFYLYIQWPTPIIKYFFFLLNQMSNFFFVCLKWEIKMSFFSYRWECTGARIRRRRITRFTFYFDYFLFHFKIIFELPFQMPIVSHFGSVFMECLILIFICLFFYSRNRK